MQSKQNVGKLIELEKTILSDDIAEQYFVCDLLKCKGACCVEGDLGAPLDTDELPIIEEILDKVKPYLSKEGLEAIEEEGPYILDEEGDFSTTTVKGRECAFAIYEESGILKCAIEKAWKDGKIDYQKPISCHLYPIRAKEYDSFTALNYDRWDICSPACHLGNESKVPLYKFLKGPLIRKFGENWYNKLVIAIKESRKNKKHKSRGN